MTWSVRFISKKGRDTGSVRFERCADEMEARFIARLMQQNGHSGAEAVFA